MMTNVSSAHVRWRPLTALVLAALSGPAAAAAQVPAAPAGQASAPCQPLPREAADDPVRARFSTGEDAAEALRTVARDPAAHATAAVCYEVRHGVHAHRTIAHVRGDGQVTIFNRSAEGERSFAARLSAQETAAMLRSLVAHRLTEQHSHRKTGSPEDAPMVLGFRDPASGTEFRTEIWDDLRLVKPDTRAIVALFQKLLSNVSKGAIRG